MPYLSIKNIYKRASKNIYSALKNELKNSWKIQVNICFLISILGPPGVWL